MANVAATSSPAVPKSSPAVPNPVLMTDSNGRKFVQGQAHGGRVKLRGKDGVPKGTLFTEIVPTASSFGSKVLPPAIDLRKGAETHTRRSSDVGLRQPPVPSTHVRRFSDVGTLRHPIFPTTSGRRSSEDSPITPSFEQDDSANSLPPTPSLTPFSTPSKGPNQQSKRNSSITPMTPLSHSSSSEFHGENSLNTSSPLDLSGIYLVERKGSIVSNGSETQSRLSSSLTNSSGETQSRGSLSSSNPSPIKENEEVTEPTSSSVPATPLLTAPNVPLPDLPLAPSAPQSIVSSGLIVINREDSNSGDATQPRSSLSSSTLSPIKKNEEVMEPTLSSGPITSLPTASNVPLPDLPLASFAPQSIVSSGSIINNGEDSKQAEPLTAPIASPITEPSHPLASPVPQPVQSTLPPDAVAINIDEKREQLRDQSNRVQNVVSSSSQLQPTSSSTEHHRQPSLSDYYDYTKHHGRSSSGEYYDHYVPTHSTSSNTNRYLYDEEDNRRTVHIDTRMQRAKAQLSLELEQQFLDEGCGRKGRERFKFCLKATRLVVPVVATTALIMSFLYPQF